MNLYNAMAMKGASRQQLESGTFKMAEQCIAEDAALIEDTARDEAQKLAQAIDKASSSLTLNMMNANSVCKDIDRKVEAARKQIALAEATTVKDPTLMDAVKAFKLTLEYAKDVLGEDVIKNPDVASMALQEAGFIAWRGIMGPKELPEFGKPGPLR